MNAELYLKKAVLQLAKGLEEKSIESLNKVLETGGDDQISLIKAHLIFAEYYIMKGDFPQAEEVPFLPEVLSILILRIKFFV